MESGSTSLTVNGITGYKYTYDEVGANQTNYASGHVTAYNVSGSSDYTNINQGDVTGFDVPEEGVGYYIAGDEAWCLDHGFVESDKWKYSAAIRMDEDTVYGNKALISNIHLTAGTNIKIRHHYFTQENGDVVTKDDWISALDNNDRTTTAAERISGNIQIKANQSGYYNLYFTSSSVLSFYNLNYDITFVTNGGTFATTAISSYVAGTEVTLPTSTDIAKVGYTFGGWFDNSSCKGSAVTVIASSESGSKTYYANWIVENSFKETIQASEQEPAMMRGDTNVAERFENRTAPKKLSKTTGTKHSSNYIYLWLGNIRNVDSLGNDGWATGDSTGGARIYVHIWDATSAANDIELNYKEGDGAGAVWCASLSGLTIGDPTGMCFVRSSPSGWTSENGSWETNKWHQTNDVDFSYSNNQYKLTGSRTAVADCIKDESDSNEVCTSFYTRRNGVSDQEITAGTSYSLSFAENDVIKVYRRVTKYLFTFGSAYSTNDTWFHAYGHISESAASPMVSADGDSNAKASRAFDAIFTFTHSNDSTYTYSFVEKTAITLNNKSATIAGASSVTAVYGESMPSIAGSLPSKTGYTFGGYYASSDGGTTLTTKYIAANGNSATEWNLPGKTFTLYAKWTANSDTAYQVEHYQQNTDLETYTLVATDNMTGTTDTQTAAVANTYTGFTAQSFSQANIDGDGTRVIRIDYNRNTYTVTLNTNSGTINADNVDSYTYGIGATLPTNVTKTGYTFAGWYGDSGLTGDQIDSISTSATGSKTYWAKWTINTHTVSATPGDGVDSVYFSTSSDATTGVGTTFNYNQKVYVFAVLKNGWTADADWTQVSGSKYMVTSHTLGDSNYDFGTISASTTNYTITYDVNEGDELTPVNDSYTISANGQTVTLDMPSRDNYTFTGYEITSNTSGSSSTASNTTLTIPANAYGDITVQATWAPKVYTITLDDQSGSGGAGSIYEKYNTGYYKESDCRNQMTTSANEISVPTRTNYAFGGYYTQTGGRGAQYIDASGKLTSSASATFFSDETASGNLKLFAKWSYTVHFNANGTNTSGSLDDQTLVDGVFMSLTLNNRHITRVGYTFTGWNSAADGSGTLFTNGQPISSPANMSYSNGAFQLYARWAVCYIISYNNNGGTGIHNDDYEDKSGGSATTDLPTTGFSMDGYLFVGWNTSATGGTTTNDEAGIHYYAKDASPHFGKDVTLYAIYTKTVTLNKQDGAAPTTSIITVAYNSTPETVSAPTRSGDYAFQGYYTAVAGGDTQITNSSGVFSAVWTYTGNVLFAKWTISVNLNNQSATTAGAPSVAAVWNAAMPSIADNKPAKTGYTFGGYYTGTNGSGDLYIKDDGTSNTTYNPANPITTLFAKWIPNVYNIAYKDGGDVAFSGTHASEYPTTHTYGTATDLLGATKDGYAFDGWFTTSACTGNAITSVGATAYTSDFTLYAKWTPLTYTIQFNANDAQYVGTATGSTATISNISYGSGGTLTSNGFSRAGYTFAGWATSPTGSVVHANGASRNNVVPTSNNQTITLYAKWSALTYSIQFNANDAQYVGTATGSTATISNISYGSGGTLTPNGFSRTGYTFAGWATSPTGSVVHANGASRNNVVPTSNGQTITLYAKWNTVSYTISYDLVDGSLGGSTNPTSYTIESDDITLNNPTKTGYQFAGWTGTGLNSATTSVTIVSGLYGDRAYVATWTANTYYVSFKANGGSSSMSNQTFRYGTAQSLTANGFGAPTGKHFIGWDTDSSGTTVVYANSQSVENLTTTQEATIDLYAVWATNTYTIVFHGHNGAGQMTSMTDLQYGVQYTLTANGFTGPNHYVFAGWDSANSGTSVLHQDQGKVTYTLDHGATVNLYAVWKITIAFDKNGGSGSNMANMTYYYGKSNQSLTANSYTAQIGYDFYRWNTAANGSGTYYANQHTFVSNPTPTDGSTLTLYAIWTNHVYTITLNPGDGASPGTTSIHEKYAVGFYLNSDCSTEIGTSVSNGITIPTKNGYIFLGYYTLAVDGVQYINADGYLTNSAENTNFTADGTLYAHWSAKSYTVTFDKQNGTGGSDSVSATYGQAMPSINIPTRTDHTFLGYYTGTNGTGTIYYLPDGTSAGDWTEYSWENSDRLYAYWYSTAQLGKLFIGNTPYFFKVNSNWAQSDAWFAIYLYGGPSAVRWVALDAVEGETNLYKVTLPAGGYWSKMVLCRVNPAYTIDTIDWNYDNVGDDRPIWNQSASGDLTPHAKSNYYVMVNNEWTPDDTRWFLNYYNDWYIKGWTGNSETLSVKMVQSADDPLAFSVSTGAITNGVRFKLVVNTSETSTPLYTYYDYTKFSASGLFVNAFENYGNDHDVRPCYNGTYTVSLDATDPANPAYSVSSGSFTSPASTSSKTYYLDCSNASWKNDNPVYGAFVYDASGNAKWFFADSGDKPFSEADIWAFNIDVSFTNIYFARINPNGSYTIWNSTPTTEKPSGTADYYIVSESSGNFSGSWFNFYGKPEEDAAGYYLVGERGFTGSTEVEWSFYAAIPMVTTGSALPDGTSYQVENRTLRQGMQFQVWYYSPTTGRGEMITALNNDNETNGIAYSSGNIIIKNVEGTKFTIYLTSTNPRKVMIKDTERATYLIFNNNLTTFGKKEFKMGYGDANTIDDSNGFNLAVYELGIRVTQADLGASGGVQFVIRRKASGVYTWYDYSSGLSGSYEYASQGTQIFNTNANTGVAITRPGYYKIYLAKNGKIAIAAIPGEYGEGYYIMPYDGSTDSYTGGVKMKQITVAGAVNDAVYTCYMVGSNKSIYLRAYTSGIDHGVIDHWNNGVSAEVASMENGVITFVSSGSYDIYVYEVNNTPYVSVAEHTKENFFEMNPLTHSGSDLNAAQVKGSNTSLVLEVKFTVTAEHNVNLGVALAASGSGLSSYLTFAFCVDPTLNGANPYDYMRGSTIYNSLSTTASRYDNTALSAGQHTVYILVDYEPTQTAEMNYGAISNNFHFDLMIRQAAS